MVMFREGGLEFEFGKGWRVVKYDKDPAFMDGIRKLNQEILTADGTRASFGTCGIDLIAVHGKAIYFIEIKDFRGSRIPNKRRIQNNELAMDVGIKVRDSLAGIVGAHHRCEARVQWEPFMRPLIDTSYQVHVLLWLEQDRNVPDNRRSLTDQLKTRLSWLTNRVLVVDNRSNRLPDLNTRYRRQDS